ncbi:MAG: helix-turn-helix domain-containing protein [Prolixibacteraceae bacterium]|nr:helix-turn-helix domain-containing protein [Prolixibacteraceae bacterium]NLX29125.1 helix-turn-helix domain-containing protein [Bacteroidales bacterium]HOY52082.1 helix-turn-helix domain-containing protein [Prolixibacteraceae bacterium]
MESIKYLRAAKKFGPGYFIREQMEIRGWVQEELADILGISVKHLSSILLDKQPISIENARKLAIAFNTSAQYWLNLDNDYRLWMEEETQVPISVVEDKVSLYSRMPIRDMMKKGWLSNTKELEVLIKEVKNFWGIRDLEFSFIDNEWLPLWKKSQIYNQFSVSYAATWYQMARNYSQSFSTPPYRKETLERLFTHITDYTTRSSGIEQFIHELNNCGVKFFVLPHLEKTYLDGAAFLMKDTPIVVYTARYKRIDNFWFTVAHEIAHILRHLNEDTPFVLDNFREVNNDKLEDEANKIAARQLKHNEILAFLESSTNYLTVSRVTECSKVLNVHPSIIIGALAFNKKLSYRNQSLFNENVLEFIPGQFIHDSLKKD